MVFGSIISSPRGNLSFSQVLGLASIYLENARIAVDRDIALVLCHDTEVSLNLVKRAAKNTEDKAVRAGIATVYIGLGDLLTNQGHQEEAQAFFKKSEKWGGTPNDPSRPKHSRSASLVQSIKNALHSTTDTSLVNQSPRPSVSPLKQGIHIATLPQDIFPANVRPPTIEFNPPEPDMRLNDTPQLAYCLSLLQASCEPDEIIDPTARKWLHATRNDPDEQERLKILATDVIRAFKRDEIKDSKAVTEVVYLAPVLGNDDFRHLLKEFYSGIDQSALLDIHQLEGIAQLVQGANTGYLDPDDLVKVLTLLSTRLIDTHRQSTTHIYQLTLAVSHVLDAMADTDVKGLDREKIHEPLSLYLEELKKSSDPYMVYQAAYAYQALLCVPDNESLWQATLRRTGKVMKGVSGLVSAVKGIDLNGFIEGLLDIQKGLAGASEMVHVVKTAYDGATSLAKSGQGFLECLKEGLSFSQKCVWYTALRGADTLIRDGQLSDFKKLVCEAPCRMDVAFQWGVCQRLGEIASNPLWDQDSRQGATVFLGEMYRNDHEWGDHANIKHWILSILVQLSSGSSVSGENQFAEALLQELRTCGDTNKQALYAACRGRGSTSHPLDITLPTISSPSLIDRVQERPDVEGNIRQLRRMRLKDHGNAVYISPQAKSSLQVHDDASFPLIEKVQEFLTSDHKVFLLLGDSGAGKSTFNRVFECNLWQSYRNKTCPIPLHINLPAIDKPEHDMIAKQLRKVEFTEPQIRELKLHREFILICDGYDESQQIHNLYTSNRLNEPGEWRAKMIITCRSEYLGVEYRDRFQPGDRNHRSNQSLLQEAVITPFSKDQVQEYITQYVSVHRPLWKAEDYRNALNLIPSLNDLVKNPFLMSLSLEVLPRMVDPAQDLASTRITRVSLYDQFIEHWLERGKKRLGEKNLSPQTKSAFESLVDEGFTRNGIVYLKRLSVAIYKEQDGQPIVSYSRYKDENSWKSEFFSREDEKQLLREACPLMRNGNQYRFIHRSLLEYGLTLGVFDPEDWKMNPASELTLARRGSILSLLSSDGHGPEDDILPVTKQEPDIGSPLAWRNFIKEPSLLQFLEERVDQEPLFKQQLLEYIEHSKIDKKWRIAAANAITILVRTGVHFNYADLRGIRIPKADLSYGMFDSAQLQGADLRQVDLRGSRLCQADLSNALMTDVQFGEFPLLKQVAEVGTSVFSPDGMLLAVGLDNGDINVYSTSTWDRVWTQRDRSGRLQQILYSPDGHQLASSSGDGAIRLWDTESWTCLHILSGFTMGATYIAYSPDGNQLASASVDCTVRLWDTQSGECHHILIGHTRWVNMATYSPCGSQIASCSDTTIRLWNTQTEYSHTLRGHGSAITMVDYSPNGKQLVSTSYDGDIRQWDVASGECLRIIQVSGDVKSLKYSPKGDQMASAGYKNVILWDVDTGVRLHTLIGHSASIQEFSYSSQGNLLATTSEDYAVRLWDTETRTCRQIMNGHSDRVRGVAFSPGGDLIASSSSDMTVRLWDVGAGISYKMSSRLNSYVEVLGYSPKRDRVASSNGKIVWLWDVGTGGCRCILRGHDGQVSALAYSPQGDYIATGSQDKTVRLWDTETETCTHTFVGHTDEVKSVTFSPQGDLISSVGHDKTVRLWDVRSGVCRYTYESPDHVYESVFSPNGKQTASCGDDRTVRLWNVETGGCDFILKGHHQYVFKVQFSPQGDQIASSDGEGVVRLWDTQTGECRQILIGHQMTVTSITFSPQGDQIASGCRAGAVRLWDLRTGSCTRTSINHKGQVNRIVYSPQGSLIASVSDGRSVRIWDPASGKCRAAIEELQDKFWDIDWAVISDIHHLVTGCLKGGVQMWRLTEDGDQCSLSLLWSAMSGTHILDVAGSKIQDVRGLSSLNKRLLKQGGAVGEPINRQGEAVKKLTSMASAMSKFKAPSERPVDDPVLSSGASFEQTIQKIKQAQDPQLRDIGSKVAAFLRDIHGCV